MRHLLITIVAIASLCSCSMRNLPAAMDSFVDNAELKGENYSDQEWKQSISEFEEMIDQYKNSDEQYSQEEKEMAAKSIGRYHALLVKQGLAKSKGIIESLGKIIPQYLEGFASELGKDSDGLLESLESLVDTTALESSMEKLGASLEKLFE